MAVCTRCGMGVVENGRCLQCGAEGPPSVVPAGGADNDGDED